MRFLKILGLCYFGGATFAVFSLLGLFLLLGSTTGFLEATLDIVAGPFALVALPYIIGSAVTINWALSKGKL